MLKRNGISRSGFIRTLLSIRTKKMTAERTRKGVLMSSNEICPLCFARLESKNLPCPGCAATTEEIEAKRMEVHIAQCPENHSGFITKEGRTQMPDFKE